jgi:hypothetical protein
LTLWNFFFPYNNTHHNKKKIINVMISMFDLKNSKIWHKFSCIIIVTSYWKVQCAHSNHDSICAYAFNVSSYTYHTTRWWWHVLLVC